MKRDKIIELSAEASAEMAPDKALINVSFSNVGNKSIQTKMLKVFKEFTQELVDNGFDETAIETVSYSFKEIGENFFSREYSLNHCVGLTLTDVGNIGRIVNLISNYDGAVLSDIIFQLSKENSDKLTLEAYDKASKQLNKLAKKVVKNTGGVLGKPLLISERGVKFNGQYGKKKMSLGGVLRFLYPTTNIEECENTPSTDIKMNKLGVSVKLLGIFQIK